MSAQNADYGWHAERDGLAWRGGWWSASHIAELLSGEDEGRITTDAVRELLAQIDGSGARVDPDTQP